MINNNLFSIIIPPLCIYKLMVTYVCTAGVEKEGLRTMENAWSTMEKFFCISIVAKLLFWELLQSLHETVKRMCDNVITFQGFPRHVTPLHD